MDLLNAIKQMPARQWIDEGLQVINIFKDSVKTLTESDKQILDTCQSRLTNGNTESFEERKYFLETMKEFARRKDVKTAIFGAVTAAAAAAGIVAKFICNGIRK